jgi:hypothetical protein
MIPKEYLENTGQGPVNQPIMVGNMEKLTELYGNA